MCSQEGRGGCKQYEGRFFKIFYLVLWNFLCDITEYFIMLKVSTRRKEGEKEGQIVTEKICECLGDESFIYLALNPWVTAL